MRTAIVSDTHLGSGTGSDLLQRPEAFDLLLNAIRDVDRLVLLGDIVEFRDRPAAEALDIAFPVLERIGSEVAGEIVIVPGNHDHRFVTAWLESRALKGAKPLRLGERVSASAWPAKPLVEAFGRKGVRIAYPGIWLRDDVYATHGHYLDRHLTIPTFERLGLALVERTLGLTPTGADPLDPPEHDPEPDSPDDYERISAPVFAFLYALAQSGAGSNHPGGTPTKRIWDALSGGSSRTAKVRGWLLGSVALPGAVGVANRLGIGPVRADLSPTAITLAGIEAMDEVTQRLQIDARHVIFGHTHRRGPLRHEDPWHARDDGPLLWNTGSWVHSPGLLRTTSERSAYWPGTVGFLEDEGPPELVHLLDEWTREDLAG